MRRQLWFVSIGIVTVATIACEDAGKRNASVSSTCPHDKELRTYQQWLQTVTFPSTGPEAKLRRVKDNYSHVDIGSSKEEIVKAFGPADFEQELYPKESHRPGLGFEFMYYFEKPEGETVNEFKDKRIEVFFTSSGKVKRIVGNVG